MKRVMLAARIECTMVAPLAGAWIETLPFAQEANGKNVAPLAGAWIETQI